MTLIFAVGLTRLMNAALGNEFRAYRDSHDPNNGRRYRHLYQRRGRITGERVSTRAAARPAFAGDVNPKTENHLIN